MNIIDLCNEIYLLSNFSSEIQSQLAPLSFFTYYYDGGIHVISFHTILLFRCFKRNYDWNMSWLRFNIKICFIYKLGKWKCICVVLIFSIL